MTDETSNPPPLAPSDHLAAGPMPRNDAVPEGLVLVPTPLSNLGDMTTRAIVTLTDVTQHCTIPVETPQQADLTPEA